MAYTDRNGVQRFSTKDKMNYHTNCANKGVDGKGKKLTTTQRIRHAMLAEDCRKSINRHYDNVALKQTGRR